MFLSSVNFLMFPQEGTGNITRPLPHPPPYVGGWLRNEEGATVLAQCILPTLSPREKERTEREKRIKIKKKRKINQKNKKERSRSTNSTPNSKTEAMAPKKGRETKKKKKKKGVISWIL